MNNNPFYVLSMEYKKNEKKKRESFVIPKAPCCVWCKFDPVSFLHGHYKGMVRILQRNVGMKIVNQKVNETMLFIEDSLKEKIKKKLKERVFKKMSGITIVLRSPEDIQKIKELEEKIKKFEELPPLSNPEDLQKIKELEKQKQDLYWDLKRSEEMLDFKNRIIEKYIFHSPKKILYSYYK